MTEQASSARQLSLAAREREALADTFLRVGPDAPTLCEGWQTRDLVAHLVVREYRPDAAAGMAIPLLGGYLRSTMDSVLSEGYERAVQSFRAGPPSYSPFAIPGMDERANTVENFVHHEDVLRAQEGWQPRELSDTDIDTLWKAIRQMGWVSSRRHDGGLILVAGHGPRTKIKGGEPTTIVRGPVPELLMWLLGRTDHARVEVEVREAP
ncbi:MAG: TIGR03085 family protein [Micrococcales bacterium]|nr:MAG: TIGR03085 family protein [Micrococcales bacterium]PIE27460.1 MAG: TIGR03085 family protein [Micrococcales bacterium]